MILEARDTWTEEVWKAGIKPGNRPENLPLTPRDSGDNPHDPLPLWPFPSSDAPDGGDATKAKWEARISRVNPGVSHMLRLKLLKTGDGPFLAMWVDNKLWEGDNAAAGARWMQKERRNDSGALFDNKAKIPWFIKLCGGQRRAVELAYKDGQLVEEGSLLWHNGFQSQSSDNLRE